ncbi:GMC family oxidoreductase [Rhodopseudomonas sp. G2_2311]|uniref:GMC oxidoreductase n=1 Tax=Rhodopseudomonas sp. G2_2311 TaxID=3114287 RepID=UPI0039C73382
MLIDLSRSADRTAEFRSDICIIGGGPAGITIARELIDCGKTVILAESGGLKQDRKALSLYEGVSVGHPVELTVGRYRVLGGSSIMWGGRCARLDPMDFECRDWIPRSGWPISYDELTPYYERAIRTCNFHEEWKELSDVKDVLQLTLPLLEAGNLSPFVWRVAPPDPNRSLWNWLTLGYRASFKFGSAYLHELKSANTVKVLLHANLVKLIGAPGDRSIQEAIFTTLDGRSTRVVSKEFVVACSGIENPRILLNMPDQLLKNANPHGQIGRCFAQHPRGIIGVVEASEEQALRLQKTFNNFMRPKYVPVQYEVGLALTEQAQRMHKLLNASLCLYYEADDYSIWKAGRRVREAIRGRTFDRRFLNDVLTVTFGIHSVGMNVIRRWILGREVIHKKPIIRAVIDLEQVPRPDSRITLASEMDSVGMRKCVVDWKLGELELRTARMFAEFLDQELKLAGLGALRRSEWLARGLPFEQNDLQSNLHFIGATRMADRAEDGVVDRNCKVFGLDNVYMAGASVFPIGGHANPMVTIVALATRLGELLRNSDSSSR